MVCRGCVARRESSDALKQDVSRPPDLVIWRDSLVRKGFLVWAEVPREALLSAVSDPNVGFDVCSLVFFTINVQWLQAVRDDVLAV